MLNCRQTHLICLSRSLEEVWEEWVAWEEWEAWGGWGAPVLEPGKDAPKLYKEMTFGEEIDLSHDIREDHKGLMHQALVFQVMLCHISFSYLFVHLQALR